MLPTQKISLLLVILSMTVIARAEQNPQFDTEALQSNKCLFEGKFIQERQVIGLEQTIQSAGHFYHHCKMGVIWKTNHPIEETLIFAANGERLKIEDGQTIRMTSKQSRILGDLMVGLIGWKKDYVEQNFTLQHNEEQPSSVSLTLLPKKRSLKRALTKLNFDKYLNPQTGEDERVEIVLTDKKSQKITIVSHDLKFLEEAVTCKSLNNFTQQECSSLLPVDQGENP